MLEVYQALFRPLTCFVFSPGGLEYGFFGLKVCGLPPQSWPEQSLLGEFVVQYGYVEYGGRKV